MIQITHNNLPEAVQLLFEKLDSLEATLISRVTPPPPAQDDLMKADQAAEYLGKATQTIYGLVARKAIPHIGKGKQLRFSKIDLKNWLIMIDNQK